MSHAKHTVLSKPELLLQIEFEARRLEVELKLKDAEAAVREAEARSRMLDGQEQRAAMVGGRPVSVWATCVCVRVCVGMHAYVCVDIHVYGWGRGKERDGGVVVDSWSTPVVRSISKSKTFNK